MPLYRQKSYINKKMKEELMVKHNALLLSL